jgi:hypothetical protein
MLEDLVEPPQKVVELRRMSTIKATCTRPNQKRQKQMSYDDGTHHQ